MAKDKEKDITDLTKIPEDIMTEEERAAKEGKGNVFIGTLNVALSPAKAITSRARQRYYNKYKGKYRRSKALFYFDMVLLGVIVILFVVLGFLYFYKPSIVNDIEVTHSIMQETVTSGEEVSFVWIYKNNSEMILDDVYWTFNLPTNFEVMDTAPKRTDPLSNILNLGTLPPGGEGRIKLHGRVWGEIGDTQTIWSNLGFVQAENSRAEKKVITTSYTVDDSVLRGGITAPEKVINNQEIDFQLTYENKGEDIVEGVKIHAYWPGGYQYISSDIPLVDNVWHIGDLEPGVSGEINVRGYIASPDEIAKFYFENYLLVNDEDVRQEVLAALVEIVPPQIQISTEVNGEFEPVLSWGERAQVDVYYNNIGDLNIEDLGFALEIDPYYVNTSRLEGLEFRDGRFYITQQAEAISPGESKKVTGIFYLKSSPDFSQFEEVKDILLNIGVDATYRVSGEEQRALYKTSRQSFKINTPFWAQVFARYWASTGDQLGRGPIPPRVGSATKYWIFWNLGDTTNDTENIFVQFKLPANVTHTGLSSVTAGDKISYNPDTRMITWAFKELPSTFSGEGERVAISFEVEVVPTPDQAGGPATLVEWTKMTGNDQFTHDSLGYSTGVITTNLSFDKKAQTVGGNVR